MGKPLAEEGFLSHFRQGLAIRCLGRLKREVIGTSLWTSEPRAPGSGSVLSITRAVYIVFDDRYAGSDVSGEIKHPLIIPSLL